MTCNFLGSLLLAMVLVAALVMAAPASMFNPPMTCTDTEKSSTLPDQPPRRPITAFESTKISPLSSLLQMGICTRNVMGPADTPIVPHPKDTGDSHHQEQAREANDQDLPVGPNFLDTISQLLARADEQAHTPPPISSSEHSPQAQRREAKGKHHKHAQSTDESPAQPPPDGEVFTSTDFEHPIRPSDPHCADRIYRRKCDVCSRLGKPISWMIQGDCRKLACEELAINCRGDASDV